MKWRVEISIPALKQLEGNKDVRVRGKLFERIEQLENEPENQGKPLKDELSGLRSVRAIGQRYRIIYKLKDEQVLVIVAALGMRREGDRSDIYKIAERLLRSGFLNLE
jgi:mRNA interferase RelE/StbE